VKAHKTSGGRKMPVRHTIPLGIVIFLVIFCKPELHKFGKLEKLGLTNLELTERKLAKWES